MLSNNSDNGFGPQNMNIAIGNMKCSLLFDSGSASSINNLSLGKKKQFVIDVLQNNQRKNAKNWEFFLLKKMKNLEAQIPMKNTVIVGNN